MVSLLQGLTWEAARRVSGLANAARRKKKKVESSEKKLVDRYATKDLGKPFPEEMEVAKKRSFSVKTQHRERSDFLRGRVKVIKLPTRSTTELSFQLYSCVLFFSLAASFYGV